MNKYRLKIIQRKEHIDVENYLLTILTINSESGRCVTILQKPRRKSYRSIPMPGIKWIGGLIELQRDDDCRKAFNDAILHNDYFHISLITLN
jgi:hypothetical protein